MLFLSGDESRDRYPHRFDPTKSEKKIQNEQQSFHTVYLGTLECLSAIRFATDKLLGTRKDPDELTRNSALYELTVAYQNLVEAELGPNTEDPIYRQIQSEKYKRYMRLKGAVYNFLNGRPGDCETKRMSSLRELNLAFDSLNQFERRQLR